MAVVAKWRAGPPMQAALHFHQFSSSSLPLPLCLHIFRTCRTFLLPEVRSFYSRKLTSNRFALPSCSVVTIQTAQFSFRLLIEFAVDSVRLTVSRLEMEQGKADVGENFPHAERHAYRDDMGDSYGAAYTTRSADEGYGEVQRSATSERDALADPEVHPEYDRTQGHPVAQLEHAPHASTSETATENKSRGAAAET